MSSAETEMETETETVEWGRLSHLFVTVFLSSFTTFLVLSAIADVTVGAVCHGKDECSLAIYLTGFQQAISGLGSVVMMPLLGNLSDSYGRKNLLTIPMILAIIPLVILAWKRTKNWVYAYYAFKTLTAMVSDGGVVCLALGYLADSVADVKRVGVFSVLYGVMSAANIFSTLAARFLSISHIFQVGAFVSIAALVYMRIFLQDSTTLPTIERPLMFNESIEENCPKVGFNGILLPKEVFRLLNTSSIFAIAACVTFFTSLAESASSSFLTYFWKFKFSFKKDQIAIVFLIQNIVAAISNVFCMPIAGRLVGETTLLSFALLNGFLCMLFNSIAWSPWVPGASMTLAMFFTIWASCLKSIVSKEVGSSEQGITQGCIMGITSLANTISPLIFSPLTDLFLSEKPPFHFPGFSMLCIGLVYLIGFILSVMILLIKRKSKHNRPTILID